MKPPKMRAAAPSGFGIGGRKEFDSAPGTRVHIGVVFATRLNGEFRSPSETNERFREAAHHTLVKACFVELRPVPQGAEHSPRYRHADNRDPEKRATSFSMTLQGSPQAPPPKVNAQAPRAPDEVSRFRVRVPGPGGE